VSLTDVGNDYLLAAAPAVEQLRQAAEDATGRGGRPTGSLRLTMPREPFDLIIADTLVDFKDTFPEVELEIAVEARLVDIVKQGYDAGLRFGNHLEKDMVAVQIAPPSTAILVAAPAYLANRPVINNPSDLLQHRAIVCRSQITGSIIPWTLVLDDDRVQISPSDATIVHDLASQIDLAVRGLGIISVPSAMVTELIDRGILSRVLCSWSSPMEALYIYFPSRRHQSAALRAFVGFLKSRS
jgi:DNA-binding transcriptional LysR family regulator